MSTTIAGVSSMATRLILGDLVRRYQEARGVAVTIRSMGGVDAAELVRAGEVTDIVIMASGPMAKLEADGFLVAGASAAFARSGMGLAIRAGAPHPDIHDADAVRRAVLGAGKVGYSTGPSGDHLLKLCQTWGVDPGRLVKAPPGKPVVSLVAQGEADLGFQQLSELLGVPGVEVVGPLPPEIQATTVFTAGVCAKSSKPAETRALIAFLTSPEADAAKRLHGMEPAR